MHTLSSPVKFIKIFPTLLSQIYMQLLLLKKEAVVESKICGYHIYQDIWTPVANR